jgi:hypothetical protein
VFFLLNISLALCLESRLAFGFGLKKPLALGLTFLEKCVA